MEFFIKFYLKIRHDSSFWQFIIVNSRQGLCPEGIPFSSKETRVLKNNKRHLTLFRMVIFGAADKWEQGMAKNPILHKICQPYPTMMKLGTLILYLSKIQKYVNYVTYPLGSADISIFLLEISKFCYIKKCRYSFRSDT